MSISAYLVPSPARTRAILSPDWNKDRKRALIERIPSNEKPLDPGGFLVQSGCKRVCRQTSNLVFYVGLRPVIPHSRLEKQNIDVQVGGIVPMDVDEFSSSPLRVEGEGLISLVYFTKTG